MKPDYRKMLEAMPLNVPMTAAQIVAAGGAVSPSAVGQMCRRAPEYVKLVPSPRNKERPEYLRYRELPQPVENSAIRRAKVLTFGTNGCSSLTYQMVSLPAEPWSVGA